MHLCKDQVKTIWDLCFEKFKKTLTQYQRRQKWAYWKSCFEAMLRNEAGSCFVAHAIWEIGLPRRPSFATEQQPRLLSAEELEGVPRDVGRILQWLNSLAATLGRHRATKEYDTAKRKSGAAKHTSGLSPAELEKKEAICTARWELAKARSIRAELWKAQKWRYLPDWQQGLLDKLNDGSLERRVWDLTKGGGGNPKCRRPSVAQFYTSYPGQRNDTWHADVAH